MTEIALAVPAEVAPASAGPGSAPAALPGQAPDGSVGRAPAPAPDTPAPPATSPDTPAPPAPAADPLEPRYKALQAEYTRLTQTFAPLAKRGDLPTLTSRLDTLDQLVNDPEFQQWAKARIAKEQAGASDPETVRALELIEQIAEQKVQERLAPLEAERFENRMQTVFSQMREKHGVEWETFKPKMREILDEGVKEGWLSPDFGTNFTFKSVERLYHMATAADPQYAARAYQRQLEAKKANVTTASLGSAPAAVGPPKVTSFEDAYRLAKQQHGMA